MIRYILNLMGGVSSYNVYVWPRSCEIQQNLTTSALYIPLCMIFFKAIHVFTHEQRE